MIFLKFIILSIFSDIAVWSTVTTTPTLRSQITRHRVEGNGGPTVRIGTSVPMATKGNKHMEFITNFRGAYELFFERLAETHGGIRVGGQLRPLELVVMDHREHSNTDALIRANYLEMSSDGIHFFLAPHGSSPTLVAVQTLNSSSSVIIAPSSTSLSNYYNDPANKSSGRRFNHLFGIMSHIDPKYKEILDILRPNISSLSTVLFSTHRNYKPPCEWVRSYALEINVTVKHDQFDLSHTYNDSEVEEVVRTLAADPPDAVVACMPGNHCSRFLTLLKRLKFAPKAVLLDTCMTYTTQYEEMGDMAEYLFGITRWAPSLDTSNYPGMSGQDYLDRYTASRLKEPRYHGLMAWAALTSLVYAIETANTTNVADVKSVLNSMKLATMSGVVQFNDIGMGTASFMATQHTAHNRIFPRRYDFPSPTWEARECANSDADYKTFYGLVDGTCGTCPAGSRSVVVDKQRLCEACPVGTYALALDEHVRCETCKTGTFASATGTSMCEPCTAGFYQDETGLTNCKLCAAGTRSTKPAASECLNCEAGSFSQQGSSACTYCAVGNYGNTAGASACDLCPDRMSTVAIASDDKSSCICTQSFYTINGTCVRCPIGSSSSSMGSDSIENCLCEKGFYMPKERSSCSTCKKGMECPKGSSENNYYTDAVNTVFGESRSEVQQVPRLLPGYWSSLDGYGPLSVFRCEGMEKCKGGDVGSVCAELLEKASCAHCRDGYYWNQAGCAPCYTVEQHMFLLPGVPILACPVVLIVLYLISKDDLEKWSTWYKIFPMALFILLNFMQSLALLPLVEIAEPVHDRHPYFLSALQETKIFLDPSRVLSPECEGFGDFKSSMILKSIAPLGIFVIWMLVLGMASLLVKLSGNKSFSIDVNRFFNALGTLLFSFFSSIAALCLLLFRCRRNPNGKLTMTTDLAIVCYDDPVWKDLLALAIVCSIAYLAGLMSLFTWAVWRGLRGSFCNIRFQRRWKFLFVKFNPACSWWAMVYLWRNLLYNLCFSVFTSVAQLYSALLLTICYQLLAVSFMPYRKHYANYLEIFAQMAIEFSFQVLNHYADYDQDVNIIGVLGIAVCCSLLPCTLVIVFLTYRLHLKAYSLQTADEMRMHYTALSCLTAEEVIRFTKVQSDRDLRLLLKGLDMLKAELGILQIVEPHRMASRLRSHVSQTIQKDFSKSLSKSTTSLAKSLSATFSADPTPFAIDYQTHAKVVDLDFQSNPGNQKKVNGGHEIAEAVCDMVKEIRSVPPLPTPLPWSSDKHR